MKEYGVYKNGKFWNILLPKKLKATSQSSWCTKNPHGKNWSSDYEKYTELEKIFKKTQNTRNIIFFQKVMKNVIFCQKFWKQSLQSWMTNHAQKFRI